jgi:HSP20 family protein
MSNQEQQGQRAQQGETSRPQQPSGVMTRTVGYPAGLLMTPGDFFGMSPFTLVRRMGEEMDRVLEGFTGNRGDGGTAQWTPAIEVGLSDGKYQVRVELPGVNPPDVKIEVTEDVIVLEGDRKTEAQENEGGVRLTERRYGHFYRAIPLPEGAKTEEAKAKFENGLLEITVPVESPREKRRQIPIESTAQPKSTEEKAAQPSPAR